MESALILEEAKQLSSRVEDRLTRTSKALFPLSTNEGSLASVRVEVLAHLVGQPSIIKFPPVEGEVEALWTGESLPFSKPYCSYSLTSTGSEGNALEGAMRAL